MTKPNRRPLLSLALPNFGTLLPTGEWRQYLDLARAVEEAGIDRLVVADHVAMGSNTDAYPWGTFAAGHGEPWLDPLVTLAAVGGVTSRVELATGVLLAALRNPIVLAKQAATLDLLTQGRLVLGIGAGWQKEEFDAVGVPFDRRGDVLDEVLAVVHALWEPGPASFHGEWSRFDEIYSDPKPIRGKVPIHIAGNLHRRNIERVRRWGDGWIPIMMDPPAGVAAGISALESVLAERPVGSEFAVQGWLETILDADGHPDIDAMMFGVGPLVDAGATAVHVSFLNHHKDIESLPKLFGSLRRKFDDAILG